MRLRLAAFLLLFVPFGFLPADELRTLAGKTISGSLTTITDKDVVIETKDGPIATPLAQVLALDLLPVKGIAAGSKYSDVHLIDDTVLHCQERVLAFERD